MGRPLVGFCSSWVALCGSFPPLLGAPSPAPLRARGRPRLLLLLLWLLLLLLWLLVLLLCVVGCCFSLLLASPCLLAVLAFLLRAAPSPLFVLSLCRAGSLVASAVGGCPGVVVVVVPLVVVWACPVSLVRRPSCVVSGCGVLFVHLYSCSLRIMRDQTC